MLESQVPARLVHKTSGANNWLLAVRDGAPGELEFDFGISSKAAPGLAEYIEIQRQATHAFAHLRLGASTEAVAMLETVAIRLEHGTRTADGLPRTGRITIRTPLVTHSRASVVDIGVELAITGAGVTARGSITGKYLPRRLHDRLRAASRRTVAAQGLQPGFTEDEATMGTRIVDELSVDRANPLLTDHETDHVSAMSVICALERLLKRQPPEYRLRTLEAGFLGYVERGVPAQLLADIDGGSVRAAVVQGGTRRVELSGILDSHAGEGRPDE